MTRPTPQPYPYTIPPVECPSAEMVKHLDPWYVLEFFRIEALLRSDTVEALYQKTFNSWNREDLESDPLTLKYNVIGGWRVLEGVHHTFHLYQDKSIHPEWAVTDEELGGPPYEDVIGPGVRNLRVLLENNLDEFEELMEGVTNPSRHGLDKPTRALWLAIDPARAPEAVINTLRAFLHREHKPYKVRKAKVEGDFLDLPWPHWKYSPYRDPRRPPPIRSHKGIRTWLNYFRCYDLHRCEGLSFGRIAKQVFGKSGKKAYAHARKSENRARQLIQAAEQSQWPPTLK